MGMGRAILVLAFLPAALVPVTASACEASKPTQDRTVLTILDVAAQVTATVETYYGICDASAAVLLKDGRLVIGNDEDNTMRVYESGNPQAVNEIDLTPVLGVSARRPEADIEGATVIGDKVYWVTSHGRNRSGRYRVSRYRFFETTLPTSASQFDIAASTRFSETLLEGMAGSKVATPFGLEQAATLNPGAVGGFNIEGLTATPEGGVLVGMRNPVPDGKALLLSIQNPSGVVGGEAPDVKEALLLDLNGLGVRSIEYVEPLGQYIVVAGCPDDTCNKPSVLYAWDGKANSTPSLLPLDVSGLNPEGLVYDANAKQMLVISDDGNRRINGERCKDLPAAQQRFRVLRLTHQPKTN